MRVAHCAGLPLLPMIHPHFTPQTMQIPGIDLFLTLSTGRSKSGSCESGTFKPAVRTFHKNHSPYCHLCSRKMFRARSSKWSRVGTARDVRPCAWRPGHFAFEGKFALQILGECAEGCGGGGGGKRLYETSWERDTLGWRFEGIGWLVDTSGGEHLLHYLSFPANASHSGLHCAYLRCPTSPNSTKVYRLVFWAGLREYQRNFLRGADPAASELPQGVVLLGIFQTTDRRSGHHGVWEPGPYIKEDS